MNYFVQELSDYYAEGGKEIPPQVLSVMGKPLSSLKAEDVDIYNRFIGPHQRQILDALADCFRDKDFPRDDWIKQMNPYYRPIIEEMVVRVLGLAEFVSLPEVASVRTPSIKPPTYRKEASRGFEFPSISYKSLVVIAVLLLIFALVGWWVYSATAPSRLMSKAKGEMQQGEYAAAIKHFEEYEDKYPDKEQAEEARGLRADCALEYAQELYTRGRFDEAISYYDMAEWREEHRHQADLGRTEANVAWAEALMDEGDFEQGYECCEEALYYVPEGYDTVPIMELRATVLFNWGEGLWQERNYAASAARFEKCYREWPAGGLADKALDNYIDMTVASQVNQAPPNKHITSPGNIKVVFVNQTPYTLTYFLSGPSTMSFDIAPGDTITQYILPGIYNEGFQSDEAGSDFGAGSDFTDTSTWWTINIETSVAESPPGIPFQDIMARIDVLDDGLPPEILDCVEELEYVRMLDPDLSPDTYAGYYPFSNTVEFSADIPSELLDLVIFHEWGHAYDDFFLDDEEKEEYIEMRNIFPGTLWHDPDNYTDSVEEDFAEVFAVIFTNSEWTNHTPYGPVTNVDELREMILEAAD